MTEYNGWGSSAPAGVTFGNDSPAYTLGTIFQTSLSGQTCTGARIWVSSSANVTNLASGIAASLFAVSGATGYATGSALATTAPADASASVGAWFEMRFATPVAITANTPYVIAVSLSGFIYSYISHEFTSADVAAPSGATGLVFPQSTTAHHNGQFHSGSTTITAPDSSFNDTWYGVDVLLNGGITTQNGSVPMAVSAGMGLSGSEIPVHASTESMQGIAALVTSSAADSEFGIPPMSAQALLSSSGSQSSIDIAALSMAAQASMQINVNILPPATTKPPWHQFVGGPLIPDRVIPASGIRTWQDYGSILIPRGGTS